MATIARCISPRKHRSTGSKRKQPALFLASKPLPEELQAHLADASGPCAGHASEACTGEASARVGELRVAHRVEELGAELNRLALANPGVLLQAEVPIIDTGTVEESRVGVAHCAEHFRGKGSLVEILM